MGRRMSRCKLLLGMTLGVTFVWVAPGCALHSIYEKCGFRGCPGDPQITAQVETLFARYPALEPPNLIRVQTLDRVVYLTGQVDTDTERLLAQSVAAQATGVTRVVNSIGLTYSGH